MPVQHSLSAMARREVTEGFVCGGVVCEPFTYEDIAPVFYDSDPDLRAPDPRIE